MDSLQNLVVVVQVITALAIIVLVLLQHGKGADMGAAFGSGASGSLFGASGSSNFMSKLTGVAAAVFFISTLILANFASQRSGGASEGIMEKSAVPAAPVPVPVPVPVPAPVAPAATGAAPVEAPAAAAPTPVAPVPAK